LIEASHLAAIRGIDGGTARPLALNAKPKRWRTAKPSGAKAINQIASIASTQPVSAAADFVL